MPLACGTQAACKRSLQALVLLAAASLCTGYIEASQSPPGGLDPSNTPQFILFTHDDAVLDSTHGLMKEMTDGRSFSGCPATATMFVSTRIGNDCDLMMDLYNSGYEIADHTQSHTSLKDIVGSKLKNEVLGAQSDLVACGVPESDVVGLRSPFLQSDSAVRQVLYNNGFQYDSSLIEEGSGSSLSNGMATRVWPFQMDNGVPINCAWFGNSQPCSTSESWPGLFEVPVWQLIDGTPYSMDYGANGDVDVYRILMRSFEAAYGGNRAPLPIFIHTPWLQDHTQDVKKFLDEVSDAEKYSNVYMVTIRQLLAWMQNPIPADQLTTEALGCGTAGGGPGTGQSGGGSSGTPTPQAGPTNQLQQAMDKQEVTPKATTSVEEYSARPDSGSSSSSGEPQTASEKLVALGFKVDRRLLK